MADQWHEVSYAKKKTPKPPQKPEVKPVSTPVKTETKAITNKVDYGKSNRLTKLDQETENFHVKKVPLSVARELSAKRVAKGWSQKELAQKCNFPVKEIQDIESAGAIYDGNKVDKIKRILG